VLSVLIVLFGIMPFLVLQYIVPAIPKILNGGF
jgi:hypothetical protein